MRAITSEEELRTLILLGITGRFNTANEDKRPPIYWPNETEMDWAAERRVPLGFSHNIQVWLAKGLYSIEEE